MQLVLQATLNKIQKRFVNLKTLETLHISTHLYHSESTFLSIFVKGLAISPTNKHPLSPPVDPWGPLAAVHREGQGREIFQHEGHKKNDTWVPRVPRVPRSSTVDRAKAPAFYGTVFRCGQKQHGSHGGAYESKRIFSQLQRKLLWGSQVSSKLNGSCCRWEIDDSL